jgi:cysteinyl-tRNA synthetase
VDGDVFFDTAAFDRYGRLNGQSIEELEKQENVESKREHKKRNKLDFLLWQLVDPGDPFWESPWGPGRPGWSIECTAMSVAHLGTQIDIHGGGSDLRYFHHENEIAQAECANDCEPFCGWWIHNGMLKLDGVKMSKSLGNLVLARKLMETHEPDHLRMYLLSNHIRVDADYRDGALDALRPSYERLKAAAGAGSPGAVEATEAPHERLRAAFTTTMDADFNTPGALYILDATAQRVLAGAAEPGEAAELRRSLQVLGFGFAGARGPANGDLTP